MNLRADALTLYASDANWRYYAESPVTNESSGRIRLQYHGEDVHTRYVGDLVREKVLEAIEGALKTPQRVTAFPEPFLENEVVTLTENVTLRGTSYTKGIYLSLIHI